MEALSRLIDRLCTGLHNGIARYAGGAVAAVWRFSGKVPLRLRMALGFLTLGAVIALAGAFLSGVFPGITGSYLEWAHFSQENLRVLAEQGLVAELEKFRFVAAAVAALCVVAALAALVGIRLSYRIQEFAYAAWLVGLYGALRLAFVIPSVLCTADYKLFDKLSRNALWTASLGVFTPVFLFALLMLFALALSTVRRAYGIEKKDSLGDRILHGFKTGGDDPRYRTSWYWAIGLMVFVIVAPFIFRGCGWEDPYGLVQGSGTPELQVVKVKKIKKEKKKKKYILNKWSPYILERAKIDDNKNLEEMEEFTQDTYVADQPAKQGGKLGKGGGKTGGWPKGMADAKVRFIRLEYAGGDWDQDMGHGSDYNLLIRFNRITGFPIWKETESKPISRLSKFPKHYAPPFVFLTGSRGMNVSNSEIQDLRKYLIDEGGMLFIDNGGGGFGGAVRSLVQRIFPDKPFIDIPNDDPIYRQPFVFPDGAPPFWHHDGTRAKGVRVGDRLAVFYHPGDINDAWKDGHSGASEAVAEQAFRLGINVMYYAFNAYYARHFEGTGEKK